MVVEVSLFQVAQEPTNMYDYTLPKAFGKNFSSKIFKFAKKFHDSLPLVNEKICLLIQKCLNKTHQVLTGLMLDILNSLTKVLLAQLYKCYVFEVFDCGTKYM